MSVINNVGCLGGLSLCAISRLVCFTLAAAISWLGCDDGHSLTPDFNERVLGKWELLAISETPLTDLNDENSLPAWIEFLPGNRYRSLLSVGAREVKRNGTYSVQKSSLTLYEAGEVFTVSDLSFQGEHLVLATAQPPSRTIAYMYYKKAGPEPPSIEVMSPPDHLLVYSIDKLNPTSFTFDKGIDEVQAAIRDSQFELLPGWLANGKGNLGDANIEFLKTHGGDLETDWLLDEGTGGSHVRSKIYATTNGPCRYAADFIISPRSRGENQTEVTIQAVDPYVYLGERVRKRGGLVIQRGIFVRTYPTTVEEYSILLKIGQRLGVTGMPPIHVPMTKQTTRIDYQETDIVDFEKRGKVRAKPSFENVLLAPVK